LARRILGYEVDHMGVNTEPEYQEIKRSDKIQRDHFTSALGSGSAIARRTGT